MKGNDYDQDEFTQAVESMMKRTAINTSSKISRRIWHVLWIPVSLFVVMLLVVVMSDSTEYTWNDMSGNYADVFSGMSDDELEEYGLDRSCLSDGYIENEAYANNIDVIVKLAEETEENFEFLTWQLDYSDFMRILYSVQEDDNSHSQKMDVTYSYFEIVELPPLEVIQSYLTVEEFYSDYFGVSDIQKVYSMSEFCELKKQSMNSSIPVAAVSFPEDGTYVAIEREKDTTIDRASIEYEKNEYGISIYTLRWQEVLALCMMSSMETNGEWTHYRNGETSSVDTYFLTDETIDGIIDMLKFDFDYFYNPLDHEDLTFYDYEYMEYFSYDETMPFPEIEAGDDERIPAISPRTILSDYRDVYYILDNFVIDRRKIVYKPHAFLDVLSEYVPDFHFDMMIDLLQMMPGTEDLVKKYEEMEYLYKTYETDEAVPETLEDSMSEFPSCGIRVGARIGEDFSYEHGDDVYEGEGDGEDFREQIEVDGYVGIYYEGFDASHPYHDYVYINKTAYNYDLGVSDHLTKAEISQIVSYMVDQTGGYCTEFLDTVDGWYRCQQELGISVIGFCSIVMTEGTLTRGQQGGKYGYNYFNYFYVDGYDTQYGWVRFVRTDGKVTKLLDCKSTYSDDPSVCVYEIVRKLKKYYIDNRGQNTPFEFCWHGYDYSGTVKMGVINHSFCPPVPGEDLGLSSPGTEPSQFRCWSNNCGYFINKLRARIGRS